jgi:hypothetical protein
MHLTNHFHLATELRMHRPINPLTHKSSQNYPYEAQRKSYFCSFQYFHRRIPDFSTAISVWQMNVSEKWRCAHRETSLSKSTCTCFTNHPCFRGLWECKQRNRNAIIYSDEIKLLVAKLWNWNPNTCRQLNTRTEHFRLNLSIAKEDKTSSGTTRSAKTHHCLVARHWFSAVLIHSICTQFAIAEIVSTPSGQKDHHR